MATGYNARSDRIISIRLLEGKPINITTMQVCAPTMVAKEDETESFYVCKFVRRN